MRYRSIGNSGTAVSAIALTLNDVRGRTRPAEWRDLIFAALENGINAFEITTPSPELLAGVGEAIAGVERRLLFLGLRVGPRETQGFSQAGLSAAVRAALEHSGLGYLDLVTLDDPEPGSVGEDGLDFLKSLRTGRVTLRLGVAGESDAIDGWIASGAFDALTHPYNLSSGWRERHRIKAATGRDMAVIACDTFNEELAEAAKGPKQGVSGIWKRKSDPLSGHGSYAFLDKTPGWTAEDICLAYALTEPAVTTVLLSAEKRERIESLAEVPERDLPTGVSAQIEMARFSQPPDGVERRRRA
jgi:aryl-alcohol dehydrogenase-like predicted oxidoreductase